MLVGDFARIVRVKGPLLNVEGRALFGELGVFHHRAEHTRHLLGLAAELVVRKAVLQDHGADLLGERGRCFEGSTQGHRDRLADDRRRVVSGERM